MEKTSVIKDIIREKNIVIPNILLKYYKELNIDYKELIFISYLFSEKDFVYFNIIKISEDTHFSKEEIMEILSDLTEKKLINMVIKKEDNIMKEYLDLTNLYDTLLNHVLLEEDEEEIDSNKSNIYGVIEKEFGRTLSPIEYETIKHWLDAKISEDMIKEALKEAVLNGVNNLKYIDKILYEWNKKGIRTKKDLIKENKKDENTNIFSYDWLDENE